MVSRLPKENSQLFIPQLHHQIRVFFFLQVTNFISPRAGSRESTLRTSFGSRRVFIHELFSIRDFLLNLVVDCSIVIWGPHFTSSTMEGTLTLFLTSTFFHPQLLFVTRDFCFSSKASVFHLRLFLIHDYFFLSATSVFHPFYWRFFFSSSTSFFVHVLKLWAHLT